MSSTLDKNDIANKIDKASSLDKIEELRIYYLGKKGLLTSEMKSLSLLSIEEKKEEGQKLNILKNFLENELSRKKNIIKKICCSFLVISIDRILIKVIFTHRYDSNILRLNI